MLGTCPQIQQVFNTIRKVAATDAPVFFLGESGTGKELAALAIHRRSRRQEGPFVAIIAGQSPTPFWKANSLGTKTRHHMAEGKQVTAADLELADLVPSSAPGRSLKDKGVKPVKGSSPEKGNQVDNRANWREAGRRWLV